MAEQTKPLETLEPASLLRRLGAIIYDTALMGFSIVIVAGILAVGVQTVTGHNIPDIAMALLYLAMAYWFFTFFWVRGGQTLGMRAWKIRVVTSDGQPISRAQATSRFLWAMVSWAALGLGFLAALLPPDKLAWHDRHSGTRLIRVR